MPDVGSVQLVVGVIFLVLTLGVVTVLILVARHAHGPALTYAEVTKPGYRIRRFWLVLVVVTATVAFAVSLLALPYPGNVGTAHAMNVQAVGYQYVWQISRTSFTTGQKVDFAVTSGDVNHGFGIYDPHGVLVAQVQAMPDYTNHLVVTFSTPGTYIVRCLEYCGMSHDLMETPLRVTRA
ncbi:MAG TPA: cytochrome c oxidase subunit II [Chloroflexota bacterium]|nr:cytochrome c oxidase subunit II [Chloroflexota bacterium]